jgi:hypothetical protein
VAIGLGEVEELQAIGIEAGHVVFRFFVEHDAATNAAYSLSPAGRGVG